MSSISLDVFGEALYIFYFFFFFKNRSKSTNDIQLEPGVKRYEQLQKFREQIKESESQWQDVSIYQTPVLKKEMLALNLTFNSFLFPVERRSLNGDLCSTGNKTVRSHKTTFVEENVFCVCEFDLL